MTDALNPLQQKAYDKLRHSGQLKSGQGWHFSTIRVLARRGLAKVTERRDANGTLYHWVAVLPAQPAPAAPAVTATPTHVVRAAVRNPQTGVTTFTGVSHVNGAQGLAAELDFLGVPLVHQARTQGGHHTTQDGTRHYVWGELTGGAVREFVWGGEIFRIQPHSLFKDTWAVVKAGTDEVVAAHPDPVTAEDQAKADLAALNNALARSAAAPDSK